MTDEQIRELVSGRKTIPGEEPAWGEWGAGLPKLKIGGAGQPDPEALKLAIEIRKRQRENERYFQDQAMAAGGAGKTGFAKDIADLNGEIARRTTFVNEKGTHTVALTKAAWDAIIKQAQKKLQAFKEHFAIENRKALADYLKDEEAVARKQLEWEAHRYQRRLQHDADIAEKNLDHLRDVYAFEEQRAGFDRDARLRHVEGMDAQTLQQKILVEQRKADIEIEYLEKVHEVKRRLYDMDTSRMVLEEELALKRLDYGAKEIEARIAELTQQRDVIRQQADEANDAAVQAARETAANRQTQLVRDHTKQVFESIKQQAGGVFDALLNKSQSVWAAVANTLKTAILTAMKDVITSQIAATFTRLITGQPVRLEGTGTGAFGLGATLMSWVGTSALTGAGGAPAGGSNTQGWQAAGGGYMPLDEVFKRYGEKDPIRLSLLRAMEKKTRAQAEYERLLKIDSQGMVDVVSGAVATVAMLDPRMNLLARTAMLATNPSWDQFQTFLRSFSLEEGGIGAPSLAIGPLARIKQSQIRKSTANPEPLNILFDKTLEQTVELGRKGGQKRVANFQAQRAAELKDQIDMLAQYSGLERRTASQILVKASTGGVGTPHSGATGMLARELGIERTEARQMLLDAMGYKPVEMVEETTRQASKRLDQQFPHLATAFRKAPKSAGPPFGSVREAESYLLNNLGVKRASLGDDPALANLVVAGLIETKARGGIVPPVVKIDPFEFADHPFRELQFAAGAVPELHVNPASRFWGLDIPKEIARGFKEGYVPSANPNTMFFHEAGHYAHMRAVGAERYAALSSNKTWWSDAWEAVARQVTPYAASEPVEFVAEVYSGKLAGQKFSKEVEELYEYLGGPKVARMTNPWGMSDATLAAVSNVIGGPGGTSGFSGPVRTASPTSSPGAAIARMPGTMWQNLKALVGFGQVGTDSWGGKWATIGNESANIDSLGGKLHVVGRSPAAGMLGTGLFLSGLGDRSAKGDASLIAGGAMAGYQMGGPWGAAGGAAAGGIIAGVRRGGWVGWAETGFNPIAGLFILFGGSKLLRGMEDKAREKIKDLYGVDIPDRGVLKQITDIAKQSYGGNLDMTIRTQQVRDLIQLYAMSTGQAIRGMPATVHPLDIVQKGGSLYQSPGYSNGSPLPGLGGLPALNTIGNGVASGAGGVVIQLDGPATTALLRGEAVQAITNNPRAVQGAVMTASKSNAGRRELTGLQLSPGLLTA